MATLVETTGVHRQTIHYYLRKQLLPPPCDGAGTRDARYGELHVELIQLIREFRTRDGVSLEAIHDRFVAADYDPAIVRATVVSPTVFAPTVGDLETADALCETADAAAALFDALCSAGAIAADPDDALGRYDPSYAVVLRAARELESMGLPRESVLRSARLAESLAAVEVGVLAADAAAVAHDPATLALHAEERHRGFGRLISAVRASAVGSVVRRIGRMGPRTRSFAADAIYVPSALFVRRHGLETAISAALDRSAAGAAEPCLSLGRLLLGLGRYAEAVEHLTRSARAGANEPETWSCLGLATALSGRESEGAAFARKAVALAPHSPRCWAFLGAVLALHAAATVGLGEASHLLREALTAAVHTRGLPASDTREALEVLIARGRLLTVMPVELGSLATGADDLAEVLMRTQDPSASEQHDELPGTYALYRMHAYYYLGVAALQKHDGVEAARCLRECLTIDPASRFAERAYELLSSIGS